MAQPQVKVIFNKGIPGFDHIKEYFLEPEEGDVFYRLKAVENPQIGFLLINPFIFFPDYSFDLPQSIENLLGLAEVSDVCVFSIVNIPEDISLATANLLAPIIINQKNLSGVQLVLNDQQYRTKHSIFNNQPVEGVTADAGND